MIIEDHLWSTRNDVILFRGFFSNKRDARKGQCEFPLFHHAYALNETAHSHTEVAVDEMNYKFTLEFGKVSKSVEQGCFDLTVSLKSPGGAVVIAPMTVSSPTIAGLNGTCKAAEAPASVGRRLLGHPALAQPRRKARHMLGEGFRSRASGQILGSGMAAAAAPGLQGLSVVSVSPAVLAEAGVANATEDGFRFVGCVNNTGLLNYQRCSYEWFTCAVGKSGNVPAGCTRWTQSLVALSAPHSDRQIVHELVENSLETYLPENKTSRCRLVVNFEDVAATAAVAKASAAQTVPDALTGYTSNMTYSTQWGNASMPCLCSSFAAWATVKVGVNGSESFSVFPQSAEHCEPTNCAPWNPATTPTPTPVAPPKKKGMSSGTKIAIAAAAGGGALLLGGGAAMMFFRKKGVDPAEGSLISGGRGDSYAAIADRN